VSYMRTTRQIIRYTEFGTGCSDEGMAKLYSSTSQCVTQTVISGSVCNSYSYSIEFNGDVVRLQ
jgi:hypothetical protein